jgi:hypothetical protein
VALCLAGSCGAAGGGGAAFFLPRPLCAGPPSSSCFAPRRPSAMKSAGDALRQSAEVACNRAATEGETNPNRSSVRGGALQLTHRVQRISIGENLEVQIREHFHDESPKRLGSVSAADLTGLKVWPLADPFLRRLQTNVLPSLRQSRGSDDLKPLRVLELGSGQGLLGIGLAAMGEEVVLSDPAIDFGGSTSATNTLSRLRGNIDLNRNLVGRRASALGK